MSAPRVIDAELTERFSLSDAGARITQDGYLVATPRIARTGIQIYSGADFGLRDQSTIRVYRPADQVFDKKSMRSFVHRPVTNGHPREDVVADNWADFAIGHTADGVARDGEFMRVPLMVMDGAAIKEFKDGKRELSAGYSTQIKWEPGITDAGEKYDAVMTDIRCNHVALVAAARGGPQLRIGDERQFSHGSKEQPKMTTNTRTLMVDGIGVQMDDRDAQFVQRTLDANTATIKDLRDSVADLTTKLATANENAAKAAADAKKLADEQTAKIATLEQQVKDSAISADKLDALVAERSGVFAKAATVLGDGYAFKGKSISDVRRDAVRAKLGDAMKDWSDDMITASFNTMTAGVQVSTGTGGAAAAMARDFASAGGGQPHVFQPQSQEAVNKAYDSYHDRLTNAWKTPVGNA